MKDGTPTVCTEELRWELQRVLSLYFDRPQRIRTIRRRRSNYASSYTIENLEVRLETGKRLSLIFKDMSPAALLKEARDVRPAFLYNPQREIETYRVLLDPRQLNTPVCYGTLQQPESERYWLFLERVKGPLLWQVGRIESWKRAAEWLARLHSRFAQRNGPAGRDWPQSLLRHDRDYYLGWIERARQFLSNRTDLAQTGLLAPFKRLARNYQSVVERLISLPPTLVHGEFYPSNVILRGRGAEKRICPIDWEAAARGPGLIDLAALTSGTWTAEQKQALIKAYRDELQVCDGAAPPWGQMLQSVEYCQLHLAVQWLGWASDWIPPENHGQNWLREAVELASRLGVIA